MVKNTVVELTRPDGKSTVYISVQKRPELLAPLHHKLRVKSVIYGCLVSTYCPGMDFDNAIAAGSKMTIDNMEHYVHDVQTVPAYSKKTKKDRKCPLCGK